MKRERRSARDIIETYCNELLNRGTTEPGLIHKLLVIEVIAYRMGWNDIYDRLRYKKDKKDHTWWVEK